MYQSLGTHGTAHKNSRSVSHLSYRNNARSSASGRSDLEQWWGGRAW